MVYLPCPPSGDGAACCPRIGLDDVMGIALVGEEVGLGPVRCSADDVNLLGGDDDAIPPPPLLVATAFLLLSSVPAVFSTPIPALTGI